MDKPIIQVKDLWFNYNKDNDDKKKSKKINYDDPNIEWVLKDVNLEVNAGEFVAIIGQNGAGKTTLVKHFNGLNNAVKGEVIVNHRNVKDIPFKEIAAEVGYVYQNPDHQIFNLTVDEEISFGLKHLGESEEQIAERVKEVRATVGLVELEDDYPFALGRGERQKLAVASILSMNPPILIIDEPTTGLDWKGGMAMMNLIRELHQQGHTIIMITHDMRIVSLYAQRVVVMAQGEILLDGTPKEVFKEDEILSKAFLQPPQINRICKGLSEEFNMPLDILSVDEAIESYKSLIYRGKSQ